MDGPFKFDAALSFAGQQRRLASAIFREGKKLGLNIFYDREHTAHLWGKRQSEYQQIYGPQTRYFVAIVSKDYVDGDWPQLEWSVARREKKLREKEFILPVPFDDSPLLGLPSDVNWISPHSFSAKKIAKALYQKVIDARNVEQSHEEPAVSHDVVLSLLSASSRHAVLLLATSIYYRTAEALATFFPNENWKAVLSTLQDANFVERDKDGFTEIADKLAEALRKETEWDAAHDEWISVLEPLRLHLDVGACLSLHYISRGRIADAITILADALESGETNNWTAIYLTGLQTIHAKLGRGLSVRQKCRVLNAIGIGLSNVERHDEAQKMFLKLKKLAVQYKKPHWIGQAYLNLGVSSAQTGSRDKALEYYRKAEEIGELRKDMVLISRVLGNRSQLLLATNPIAARNDVVRSIAIKESLGSRSGIAFAKSQLGHLELSLGNYKEAADCYEFAQREMSDLGMYSDLATVSLHLGRAYLELGRRSKSLAALKRSKHEAELSGLVATKITAIEVQTRAYYELKQYEELKAACRELFDFAGQHGLIEPQISALHGLAVVQSIGGSKVESDHTFMQARDLAIKINDDDWIVRCTVDQCRVVEDRELKAPAVRSLRKAVLELEDGNVSAAAGRVWMRIADEEFRDGDYEKAMSSIGCAIAAYDRIGNAQLKVMALVRRAELMWDHKEYYDHIATMECAIDLARSSSLIDLHSKTLSHLAMSHDTLGRPSDAVDCQRRAVEIDVRHKLIDNMSRSIHNFGEMLRNDGQYSEAIATLVQAESLERMLGDVGGAVSTMHSRALAYQGAGDSERANKELQTCLSESQRYELWSEYARAWEALANLACIEGKSSLAERRYKRALSEAAKRGLHDVERQTGLNYANLLADQGKVKLAHRVLHKHCGGFEELPESPLYYYLFAGTSADLGNVEMAEKYWVGGLAAAQKTQNDDFIQICAEGLGGIYRDKGLYKQAEELYRLALKDETDPECRAIVLSQLLSVLLESGNEDEAQKVADEVLPLAQKNSVYDVCVDAHMAIFYYNWKKREHLDALKSYAGAFAYSLQTEPQVLSKVIIYTLQQITARNLAPSVDEIKQLQVDFATWLSHELPNRSWLYPCLICPLQIAEKVLPFVNQPKKLHEQLRLKFKMFQDVFKETIGGGNKKSSK